MSTLTRSAFLALNLVWLASAAQAAELSPEVVKRGYLSVGVEATYPPMSYRDPASNRSVGFNIDMLEQMGKELKIPVKFEEMSFEQLMSSLSTGRIDVIGTAITDLPKRRDAMSFVDYLKTGAQMFARTADASAGTLPTAFCGKSIGTPRTTNYFPETQAWAQAHCAAQPTDVQGTAGAAAARLDLQQGRVSAAVLGPEYVKHLMSQAPGTFALVGQPLSQHHFGLAVAKTDTQTRAALVSALQAMLADGSYSALLGKYSLQDQGVTEVLVDGGQ